MTYVARRVKSRTYIAEWPFAILQSQLTTLSLRQIDCSPPFQRVICKCLIEGAPCGLDTSRLVRLICNRPTTYITSRLGDPLTTHMGKVLLAFNLRIAAYLLGLPHLGWGSHAQSASHCSW